jgi:predicted nucleic acid-binding protein
MKLIIDTNILISAIVRNSFTRRILLSPYFEFYLPDYALIEIRKHEGLLREKTGLNEEKLGTIIDLIKASIDIISTATFEKHLPIAFEEMKDIDESDAPFLALALSFPNDGIWSDDKHFQKQGLVKVWRSSEMFDLLEKYKIEEFL